MPGVGVLLYQLELLYSVHKIIWTEPPGSPFPLLFYYSSNVIILRSKWCEFDFSTGLFV